MNSTTPYVLLQWLWGDNIGVIFRCEHWWFESLCLPYSETTICFHLFDFSCICAWWNCCFSFSLLSFKIVSLRRPSHLIVMLNIFLSIIKSTQHAVQKSFLFCKVGLCSLLWFNVAWCLPCYLGVTFYVLWCKINSLFHSMCYWPTCRW